MAAGKGVSKLFKAAFEGSNALIRKCGKWAGKQADNVTRPVKKFITKRQSIKAAREARDQAARKLRPMSRSERKAWLRSRKPLGQNPSKRGPVSVTGATDPETGISRAGVNHKSNLPSPRGGCAEDDALDQINKARADMGLPPKDRNQVYYSEAEDLDGPAGTEFPICNRNCQDVSDPKQYPPGTTPMGDPNAKPGEDGYGRWHDPNRTDLPNGIG